MAAVRGVGDVDPGAERALTGMADYRRYLRLRPRTAAERQRDLTEEIEAHIAMRADDLTRRGEVPARARELAEARFGDRDALYRTARERDVMMRRRDGLAAFRQDVRLAVRHARRSPGPALLTVLTFALGIGLTTAMFSLAYGVLLRPLPYAAAERLVSVQGMDSTGAAIDRTSYPNWRDLAAGNRTLESTALHEATRLAITAEAGAYGVPTQLVTPAFFDVLGTRMLTGRGFTAADAQSGSSVVVVSEGVWRRELGGRADAGMTLSVENASRVVIGVVPDREAYPAGTQLWLPMRPPPEMSGFFRNYIGAEAIARLRPGVTRAAAEEDLSAVARAVQQAEPESDYTYGAVLVGLHEYVVGDTGRYLWLLMGAVGVVLLLVCANLAAMNLARATSRGSEVAIRYALGAGRGAVVRQLLTEQLVLAVAGGVLGLLLAWTTVRVVLHAAADQLPRAHEIGLDARVLLFALVASVVAGLLAGTAPAWRAASASVRRLVGSRGEVRGGRGVPGAALVGLEVAVAVLLLIGAGLLVRSFQSVLSRDVGFSTDGVATAHIALPGGSGVPAEVRLQQWDAVLAELEANPAVAAVSVANWIPTGRGGTGYLIVSGHAEDPRGTGYDVVSEGYFDALGIPILRGRGFGAQDQAGSLRVAVINRTMAERYWPGADPVGHTFSVPGMEGPREVAPAITIIGVAGDVRHGGYEDDRPHNQVYVLHRQAPDWVVAMTVIARHAAGDAAAAGAALRTAVHAFDRTIAVEPEPLEQRLGTLVSERRLIVSVLTGFGALALLLAVIGVYAMLSFAVAQRTREIGIRAALGADRGGIVRLIMRNAAVVFIPGAAVGLVLAWWLSRVLESMLVGVTRTDALTYVVAVTVLGATAFAAAMIPARRAARLDPLDALRRDA